MSLITRLAIALTGLVALINSQDISLVTEDYGVTANIFDLSYVTLNSGRWHENQNRTLNYLKFVDPDRLLYVFRENHGLDTRNATPNGGWDAPDFRFRSHIQGHMLSAWSQCYAQLNDETCKDRALYFIQELQKCQSNDDAMNFSAGYLSGFPESEFDKLHNLTLTNGNVPYYCIHKTLQGLLDVWQRIGSLEARDVLLSLAGWVDAKTAQIDYTQMQRILETEFGGMNDVLARIFRQTGDQRWLGVAKRFDHASVLAPLAANIDQLNGLHANTQVPKWVGATSEFKATGNSTYLDIARNAFWITNNAHTYAIGGNSQSEHFRPANAIAEYLMSDTCEHCNTYNMLKLAKELWTISPDPDYFDFYEKALINHLIGAQNPQDSHGHITYFTSLNPGGNRGVGPWLGGGTWSTDYTTFWCCQGTGMEQNTKLNDAIYGFDNQSLYINLFAPSVLRWGQRNVTIIQETDYPVSDAVIMQVKGRGYFDMKVRIPSWAQGAELYVNGRKETEVPQPGTYATVSRSWEGDDEVRVRLPMKLRLVHANDDQSLAAIAYGPTILSGNYGDTEISSAPILSLDSLRRVDNSSLDFTAEANNQTVQLGPFYNAQGFRYVVYWAFTGNFSGTANRL